MSEKMAKMCPFRKKKIETFTENDENINKALEEQFFECLEGECAGWTGSACGLIHKKERPASESNEKAKNSPANSNENGGEQNKEEENEVKKAHIKVLEARETKTAGNVRAWCQHTEDGKKEAFIAKNGAGKVLLASIGETLVAKYRRLDDGTAFAVFVDGVS